MSRIAIIILLTLAVGGGMGGYYAWCYYEVLDLKHDVPKALDRIYMFRGAARVTAAQIRKKALLKLRERRAELADSDLTVTMAPLTLTNAARLPAMQRQKLTLACYSQRIDDVRDARAAKAQAEAAAGRRLSTRVPSTKPPPLAPGGRVVCAQSRLRQLNYTFVQVSAKVTLKVGWVTRRFTVARRFYLAQHPQKAKQSDQDDEDDDVDPSTGYDEP